MIRLRSAACFCLTLLAGAADAAPQLERIFPAGGQRGTTARVEVGGRDLASLTGLLASEPGITATLLPAEGDGAARARALELAIAPDAPLGKHELRVYDRTGASNPRFFWVGELPETVEQEPNNLPAAAQPVPAPVTVNGVIGTSGDVDVYAFPAKKGEAVALEVHALRLLGNMNNSWLKGFMELRAPDGRVLAANEGYYRWDPYIEFVPPEDGQYSVSFNDLERRGTELGVYRLTIGAVPHAWSLFPLGGRRGSTVAARFTGIHLGDDPVKTIQLPADAPPGLREERLAVGDLHTNPLLFHVTDDPATVEQEPNDTPETATRLEVPGVGDGVLAAPGDRDHFRFTAAKGQRLVLEILSRRAGMATDSFLTLFDAAGKQVAEADDGARVRRGTGGGERDSRLEHTFREAGEYVVQVRDLDDRGGPDFVYRLLLLPPRPDFELQASADRLRVEPGGSAAVPVNVTRLAGFAGEVTLTVEGLPEGFTAPPVTVPAGQRAAQLQVTAPAGAPHQALLLRVEGEANLDGRPKRRRATSTETYNIQGTAFPRDLIGPALVVAGPEPPPPGPPS